MNQATMLSRMRQVGVASPLRRLVPAGARSWLREWTERAVVESQVARRVNDRTILLADFPRCGIGWIRFAAATVLHYQETRQWRKLSWEEMYRYAPSLSAARDFTPYRYQGGDNLLKTHYPYHRAFRRGIIIYRNPFDAIRSMFALDHMDGKGNPYATLAGSSPQESYLIGRVKEYLEFHESWLAPITAQPKRYFVVKYEEMLRAAPCVLTRLVAFIGLEGAALPRKAIDELATMYGRADVSPPMREMLAIDEAMRRKYDYFEQIQPVTTPETLRRLDAGMAQRVDDIVTRMDATRWQPASCRGAEGHAHG